MNKKGMFHNKSKTEVYNMYTHKVIFQHLNCKCCVKLHTIYVYNIHTQRIPVLYIGISYIHSWYTYNIYILSQYMK